MKTRVPGKNPAPAVESGAYEKEICRFQESAGSGTVDDNAPLDRTVTPAELRDVCTPIYDQMVSQGMIPAGSQEEIA